MLAVITQLQISLFCCPTSVRLIFTLPEEECTLSFDFEPTKCEDEGERLFSFSNVKFRFI